MEFVAGAAEAGRGRSVVTVGVEAATVAAAGSVARQLLVRLGPVDAE